MGPMRSKEFAFRIEDNGPCLFMPVRIIQLKRLKLGIR